MNLKSSPTIAERIDRRRFAQRAATAAALVLLPTADLEAESESVPEPTGKPDDLSAAAWQEVQARHRNLIRVYGDRLSNREKVRALQILISNQHMLASVRSFSLQNSDPSACTLRLV